MQTNNVTNKTQKQLVCAGSVSLVNWRNEKKLSRANSFLFHEREEEVPGITNILSGGHT